MLQHDGELKRCKEMAGQHTMDGTFLPTEGKNLQVQQYWQFIVVCELAARLAHPPTSVRAVEGVWQGSGVPQLPHFTGMRATGGVARRRRNRAFVPTWVVQRVRSRIHFEPKPAPNRMH